MARQVKRLSNMEIDEISLVDKGANQHAMITIAKRAPEEETMPELYNEDGELLDENSLEFGDVVFDEEGNAYEFVAEDDAAAEDHELAEVGKALWQGGSKIAGESLEHVPGHGRSGGRARRGAERVRRGARQAFSNRGVVAGAAGTAGVGTGYLGAKKENEFRKSFTEEVMEELSKAYSDSDRDEVIAKALGRVEELEDRYEMAEEIAKSERDLRLTREYISKAAEYNLPVDPNELGPVLYRMAETMDYDDCAVIAKCLESAGALIFEEQGYIGGGDNADVMSQVEAHAVEIGKSADPVTISAVFDQSPEAYDAYLADRRGRY